MYEVLDKMYDAIKGAVAGTEFEDMGEDYFRHVCNLVVSDLYETVYDINSIAEGEE